MERWYNASSINKLNYRCGYCNNIVAPSYGYSLVESRSNATVKDKHIAICPMCNNPTYIEYPNQYPGIIGGMDVKGIEEKELNCIYTEARKCMSVNAYSACILCCRKALMHIAVSCGADEDKKFIYYINYLNDNGYIPPNGKEWVDKIRVLGNESTHQIIVGEKEKAELVLNFLAMLLKFIYEMPMLLKENT